MVRARCHFAVFFAKATDRESRVLNLNRWENPLHKERYMMAASEFLRLDAIDRCSSCRGCHIHSALVTATATKTTLEGAAIWPPVSSLRMFPSKDIAVISCLPCIDGRLFFSSGDILYSFFLENMIASGFLSATWMWSRPMGCQLLRVIQLDLPKG